MSYLVGLAPVLPRHGHPQEEITAMVEGLLAPSDHHRALLHRVHAAAGVRTRHLALPLEEYAALDSFDTANDRFLAEGLELAAEALGKALADAGLGPEDVDFLVFTSVTGVSAPSLDAALIHRLGLRADVRRLPSFGLGCAGGAAGLARAHDLLLGDPGAVAAVVCLELCSLTIQRHDLSAANLVATGLFGDGAAAAVLVGPRHAAAGGAQVVDSHAVLVPGTADRLGWHVGASGLQIVLSADLPRTVAEHLPPAVDTLLARHGVDRGQVAAWVVHAGGPKVIDAVRDCLGLTDQQVAASRASLRDAGNLSSVSVLDVLHRSRAAGMPEGLAVLMAFGPGVTCELVLLDVPAGS